MKFEPKDVDEVFTFYRDENHGKEPTKWEHVTIFDNQGYGIISVAGYFGAINRNGEIILPLEYDNIIDLEVDNTPIILAKKNDLWGYINWSNEIIISFQYSYASIFQNEEALVCKDGKYFVINTKNEILRESNGLKQIK